ncbi:GNAT family N-acetyltransferase [uncultured Gimesia sp.]|uniref:GNAT family N-acetyltransferase n=1 Tax=uncultured Gimesia sp. TaxID=1678688 RepID=UPI002628D518|nr:GNAT family N-acetyltransferase [uncultured Gimesia sp.]
MQFELIPYQSDWYFQACQLRNETLRKPLGLDLMTEDLTAETEYLHYGMIASSRVIACALAIPVSEIKMKIRQMTVAPQYQGQGTGRALLQNMELDFQQRGVALLELDARVTAVGFYEKLGYTKEGEEFVSISIPHLRMVKSLI